MVQRLATGNERVEIFQKLVGADTRIFSPLALAGLCVAIGHYWYLFKRLPAVSAGPFYRFEHINTYSSGKVVAKSDLSSNGQSQSGRRVD